LERSGLIDLKIPKLRNYYKFYLKRNPFPAIGIPEETPSITVDREDVIKRFQNVVWELLDTGKSIITVMVGEYGSGKTHLLKVFKKSINTQLLSSERTLAVYVKTPGEDFSYLFYGFVDDIGHDLLAQLSSRYVSKTMRSQHELLKHIFDDEARKSFKSAKLGLEETIEKLRFLDLTNDLKRSRFSGIDSDLAQAFLSLVKPELSSTAWKWFLGERLNKDEKDLLHIDASIDPKETYKLFRDFTKLFQIVGIENLVILVDELEKTTLLQKLKRDKYQDDLRRLIDDHPKNMCFYFAIAPRQWKDLTKEPTALVRRLKGNWHLLEDFKENETEELIEKYLYSARIDQYPGKKVKATFPSCDPSSFPFTDEAIVTISKDSKGVVSDILLMGRKALDFVCDSEEYTVITPELVKRAIGKKG